MPHLTCVLSLPYSYQASNHHGSVLLPITALTDALNSISTSVLALDLSSCHCLQAVNCANPYLRTVQFNGSSSSSMTEVLQAPPLPPVEQPEQGHRLVYYLLKGEVGVLVI